MFRPLWSIFRSQKCIMRKTTLHHTTQTTLNYAKLHYTTLHYFPLHYTTLHCTTLHYTALYCTHCRTIPATEHKQLTRKPTILLQLREFSLRINLSCESTPWNSRHVNMESFPAAEIFVPSKFVLEFSAAKGFTHARARTHARTSLQLFRNILCSEKASW